MAKMSDAAVPSLLITETAAASIGTPAAGKARLFRDTDNILKWKDEAGTVTSIGGGIAETLIDAKGDLIAGSAADTAARLAVGSNGKVLTANSAQSTGLEWVTPTGALLFDSEVAGADAASIDTGASGIAAGYKVLEIWLYARTDEAVAKSVVDITLNNDSGANYDAQRITGDNATAAAGAGAGATLFQVFVPGASAAANFFGGFRITIPNYTGTVGYKFIELVGGMNDTNNANQHAAVRIFNYRSTTAISRLAVAPDTAAKKFKVGSRLTIFGR